MKNSEGFYYPVDDEAYSFGPEDIVPDDELEEYNYPIFAIGLDELSTLEGESFTETGVSLDDNSRVAAYLINRDELFKIALGTSGNEAFWCPLCRHWSYAPGLSVPACGH